jgi:gamma-glutamyltranspeptidase/glutathione hydrolase
MRIYLSLLLLFIVSISSSLHAKNAAVATAHPLATQAAIDILNQGGNAFDAAITASAVLAVVEPYSSGLGGGGFWLLHRAADNSNIMLDGRETAPSAATADMYLDKQGKPLSGASINGAKAAGIPGEPAALAYLAKKYGKLPLQKSLNAAIQVAKKGFPVDAYYQRMLKYRIDSVRESPAAQAIFLKNKQIPAIGTLIKQTDLAHVLQKLAQEGKAGFYQGEIAQKLVKSVQASGGIWTKADLANYQVKLRQPVQFNYRNMKIISAALPSSGGLVLNEILNILAHYDLNKMDQIQQTHIIVEAMRRAYRDRAEFMGDSDFVKVPTEKLSSTHYTQQLLKTLSLDKATKSSDLPKTLNSDYQGNDTTHFSILDQAGNRVSATLSINYPFGSGFVAEGTGVLLNDEMDDFSIKANTPNVYGLVGTKANAISAGKRMLSSMSPTFIEDDERIALIGSPGGSRIITMVLLGILAFEKDLSAEQIVNTARFHHQYLPDKIQLEPKIFSAAQQQQLQSLGHHLDQKEDGWGNMQIVIYDKKTGVTTAASDNRGMGQSQVITVDIKPPTDK